jgi:tRNA/rRNA methyltransferase
MSQPFFTYILKCRDGLYYTGHTDDLETRIAQHHSGHFPNCFTFKRRPLELMWSNEFPSRIEALEAERKIKGWSRGKKEALIASDWVTVSALASRAKVPRVLRDAEEPLLRTNGRMANNTIPVRPEEDRRSVSKGQAQTFVTYMLRCGDGSYYVGHTDQLELKLAQHQAGTCDEYTTTRQPVELAWSMPFASRDAAFAAERRVKGWSRAKREALIAGDPRLIAQLTSMAPVSRMPVTAAVDLNRVNRPVIVLVRPQLGENIGKAARAMLNFGLDEIRLVAPRDGWPNPSAGPAAAGANMVLEKAQVFDTLAEAVADCAHVYATTVRKRGVSKPVVTPEQAAQAIHRDPGRSALVFGPERSGLDSDDVALARAILTVPINPEFASLNLAQAVILCAYEWSKGVTLAQPTAEDVLPPAPQEELEGMIGQLIEMLEPTGYFRPDSRSDVTRRTLRGVLTKPGWNHLEVRTLRGVLSSLRREPRD